MVTTTDMATGYSYEYPQPKDPKGNTAPFEAGSAKHTSSDETVATVTKDPDNELKAHVALTGKTGVYTILTEADAKLGEGEAIISGMFNGEVTPSQATGFSAPVIGVVAYEGDEAVAAPAPVSAPPVVVTEEEPTAAGTVYDKATGGAL